MSNCKLLIDDRYYANSKISGQLLCNFNSEKTVRCIKVRLKGKEHTEWLERESYYDSQSKSHKTRYVKHSGDNEFLTTELVLFGATNGSGTRMNSGTYVYDFDFHLPKILPSSFDGTYGWIRYSIKGIVDLPMKFDLEEKRFFRLISPIDFNQLSNNLQNPCSTEDEKYTCCMCCAQGPIQADMTLERRAFTVGEHINIIINVTNMSNTNVDSVNCKLTQTITSQVDRPHRKTKYENERLGSLSRSGVGAHGQNTYNLAMEIPQNLVLYNFRNSTLFDVRYELSVNLELDGCHTDLDLAMLVTLGHIKHHETVVSPPVIPTASAPSPYLPNPPYPMSSNNFPMPMGFNPPPAYPNVKKNNDDDEWEDTGDELVENRTPSAPPAEIFDASAPPPSYDDIVDKKPKM